MKRFALVAYDISSAMLVALVLAFGLVQPAFAYIDPSVMTYTIQAVAGVAVALSTVLGVALRRGRKTLMRVLDIDENAKRELEPDVHRITHQDDAAQTASNTLAMEADSEVAALHEEAQPAPEPGSEPAAPENGGSPTDSPTDSPPDSPTHPAPKRSRGFFDKRAYKPGWKERLLYGLIAAFFFTYTVYFVAPLEIVAGSANSLMYGMRDVWWVLAGPGLGIVAGITLILTLLRGRAFNVALVIVFALGLCAYAQALFMNGGLPAANGATIDWGDYMVMQVVSTGVWALLIIAALVYSLHNRRRMQGIVAVVSLFCIVVQSVGLLSLVVAPSSTSDGEGKVVMTEDQMFTVNPNHNVIVFILDTYDNAYLNRVMKMNPDLLEDLTGFTNYENGTSATIPTRFAIPEMLTGQMPSFDEPYSQYKMERYAKSSFLDQIHDANYSIGLYTDSMRISALSEAEQRGITGKTVNMHALPDSSIDYGGALYSLYTMGQYRDVPWSLKWAFWYYTDEINQAMAVYDENAPADETIYVMDDIRYYNRLCNIRLSLEDDGYDGAFRFIHLLGSHYPFNYDEEANYVGEDESDVFRQSQGAIHIVSEYVNQLKQLGVYENTTIIVTADHGYWTITLDPIEETSTPIMFVKGEQSAEEDAQPIVTDDKPVSHLDLQATILDAMGLDYSEYSERDEWAGYSMFGDIDPDRKRYYLTTDSEPDLTETQFREYLIDGYSQDWGNWSETGRTIDAQS